jgi:hypothetical protein
MFLFEMWTHKIHILYNLINHCSLQVNQFCMKNFLCIQMSRHTLESLLEVTMHQNVAEKAAASCSVRFHFIYFTFHWSYTDMELVMYSFSIFGPYKAQSYYKPLVIITSTISTWHDNIRLFTGYSRFLLMLHDSGLKCLQYMHKKFFVLSSVAC